MKLTDNLNNSSRNWVIFPEGKRNTDQMALCSEFHHGTFKAAIRSNTPIVPAAIYGTPRVLHLSPEYKKFPIFIQFLKPIKPEEYADLSTKDIASHVQEEIQRALSFHLRPIDHAYLSKRYSKRYRFNHND